MTVEAAVLGSPSPISLMVSVDVKQHLKKKTKRVGSEVRSCVKGLVAILGSPSLIVLYVVSVDAKQH